ncbi:MAG TPA: hypothetical protein VGC54_10800 [Planctomycetota bacterium]
MRLKLRHVLLAALALAAGAPLLAGPAFFTHVKREWRTRDLDRPQIDARYVEYPGHQIIEQRFRVGADGLPPNIQLSVVVNGRPLFAIPSDPSGGCDFRLTLFSPMVKYQDEIGRPARERRIDAGHEIRLVNVALGINRVGWFEDLGLTFGA